MCPRAHGGAAMARATTTSVAAASAHSSFAEEEYIDLDLSSCGEYEFRRVCRSKSAVPPSADELAGWGRHHKAAARSDGKQLDADAGAGGGCGRRSTATVAPLHATGHRIAPPEGSGRRRRPCKAMQASRAFFRSLFARTSCSDERCRGGVGVRSGSRATHEAGVGVSGNSPFGQIKNGYISSSPAPTTLRSSIELEKMMDEEEHAASVRQRKSFSGVIKWRPTPTPRNHTSSSARRKSCGSAPALKRSSSCRSESEGMIQGAIAYCKRSQHQQQQQRVMLARKSVSDAALCPSFRASSIS